MKRCHSKKHLAIVLFFTNYRDDNLAVLLLSPSSTEEGAAAVSGNKFRLSEAKCCIVYSSATMGDVFTTRVLYKYKTTRMC